MRPASFVPFLLSAGALCPLPFLMACSDDSASASDAGGSTDALLQPDAETCLGDEAGCLFGTAVVGPGFSEQPSQLKARLYRTFPGKGATELSEQLVAHDQSWAFSGLDPWAHYYVTIEPGHFSDAGVIGEGSLSVLTQVGPFSVPGNSGAPIAIKVKPVQLDVFEQGAPTAALQVVNATARVVETTQGSSSVSVSIGGSATPLAWDTMTQKYLSAFSTPPAAQPTYQMATSASTNISTWNLVADPPAFSVGITQPAVMAAVPVSKDLTVTWPLQPAADYVEVEVFQQTGTDPKGNPIWKLVHLPQIDAADVGQEVVTASEIGTAGTYLLNVAFTKANCPTTDDGCVHASTVANELFTVK